MGCMRRGQLSPYQLLQSMYWTARLVTHQPNDAWLWTWCQSMQPHLHKVCVQMVGLRCALPDVAGRLQSCWAHAPTVAQSHLYSAASSS